MKQSHNYDAKLGGDTDDMELVQRYGLDPKVAYTPAINDAMRKAISAENIVDLQRGGYSEGQARSIAAKQLNSANEFGKQMDRQK